jgi:hypothetical protein
MSKFQGSSVSNEWVFVHVAFNSTYMITYPQRVSYENLTLIWPFGCFLQQRWHFNTCRATTSLHSTFVSGPQLDPSCPENIFQVTFQLMSTASFLIQVTVCVNQWTFYTDFPWKVLKDPCMMFGRISKKDYCWSCNRHITYSHIFTKCDQRLRKLRTATQTLIEISKPSASPVLRIKTKIMCQPCTELHLDFCDMLSVQYAALYNLR